MNCANYNITLDWIFQAFCLIKRKQSNWLQCFRIGKKYGWFNYESIFYFFQISISYIFPSRHLGDFAISVTNYFVFVMDELLLEKIHKLQHLHFEIYFYFNTIDSLILWKMLYICKKYYLILDVRLRRGMKGQQKKWPVNF